MEDGARIGERARETGALLASACSIHSCVTCASSGATTQGPKGETLAGCVVVCSKIVGSLTHGCEITTAFSILHRIFATQWLTTVHSWED